MFHKQIALIASLTLAIGSSASTVLSGPQDTRTPDTTPHGSLIRDNKLKITLPENAGDIMSQKSLVLYLEVSLINSSETFQMSPKARQALRSYLESQIPKLKRFRVFGVFNDGARRLTENLQDVGDIEYAEKKQLPPPDVYLNLQVDVTAETVSNKGGGGKENMDKIFFTIVTTASLQDNTGEVIQSDAFENSASRVYSKIYDFETKEWGFTGGFNPENEDNVNAVLQAVVRTQLVDIALWLGKRYPITGKILGLSKTGRKAAIDKGTEDGLTNSTEMVLWAQDDIGIPYPLAACTVSTMPDKSGLGIERWENEDPEAAEIIGEIVKNPKIVKDGEDYTFYATSYSMPIPADWLP